MIDIDLLDLRAHVETELSAILARSRPSQFRQEEIFGLRQFLGWHRLRYNERVPPEDMPVRLSRFLLDCGMPQGPAADPEHRQIEQRMVAARLLREPGTIGFITLQRRVATLSRLYAHAPSGPLRGHAAVRDALRAVALAERRRKAGAAANACPLTGDERRRILATCDGASAGLRDRALLAAWFATASSLGTLIRLDAHALLDAVRHSRDAGERAMAVDAVTAWTERARVPGGPVFRRILADGRIGAPMSLDAVNRMLRRRLAMAASAASLHGET